MSDTVCSLCTADGNSCCTDRVAFTMEEIEVCLREASEEIKRDLGSVIHPDNRHFDTDKYMLTHPKLVEGKCILLTEDGLCSIHENKPDVCRRYGTEEWECNYMEKYKTILKLKEGENNDVK